MRRLSQVTRRLVALALEEDVGPGDVTSRTVVPEGARGEGRIVARESLVVSGAAVAEHVFVQVDPEVEVRREREDGSRCAPGDVLLTVRGPLCSLLTAERTALNFLQRTCGIATLTRRYVEALGPSPTRLLDTRKTTPGFRELEKAAVRAGGGINHRFALFDGVLIKDNHLVAVGDLREAIARARDGAPRLLKVEVEVESLEALEAAIDAGADMVLLDNFDDEGLADAVRIAGGRVPLEASGGITLDRLPRIAATGVDYVSCGAITHAARAVDIALDL